VNQLGKPGLFSVVIQGYDEGRPDENGSFAGKCNQEKEMCRPRFCKGEFANSGGGPAPDENIIEADRLAVFLNQLNIRQIIFEKYLIFYRNASNHP
jgi:hypothetical protein